MNTNSSTASKFAPAVLLTMLSSALDLNAQILTLPPRLPIPAPTPPACVLGTIAFLNGNNGQGKVSARHLAEPGPKVVPNDDVRSLVLNNVPAGTVIRLFDDSKGLACDDWVEIRVRALKPRIVIGTFEANRNDCDVQVIYHRFPEGPGNLDGKVSCVLVYKPEPARR